MYISIKNQQNMNQDNLLKDLIEGHEDAQRALLQMYGGRVFSQIARVVRSQEDAEEVYQDVFIKVFTYNPAKASLSTWLLRIAYHEALNFVRGEPPRMVSIENCTHEVGSCDCQEADMLTSCDEETVAMVEQAINRLQPNDQALISMYYYEELSTKEIAYITDSTPTTVASRLFRTRQKLQRIIKELKQ